MYCSKCGTQLPDGASFCPKCGTQLNEPAGPRFAATGDADPQAQPGQATLGQAHQGAAASDINRWPMVIDILYGVYLVMMLIMMGNPFSSAAAAVIVLMWIIALAMLVIAIIDLVYLSNIGIRGGWKWSVLIYPLYLFLRAQKTNQDYKWAVINLVEFIVGIIVAIIAGAMLAAIAVAVFRYM